MKVGVIFDFFSTRAEAIEIWNWVGEIDGVRFLETDSRPDMAVREFEKFPAEQWGKDISDMSIAAWPSCASGTPTSRYLEFNHSTAVDSGANGRTVLESPSFIYILPLDAPQEDLIGPMQLCYWTEKMARNCYEFSTEQLDEVDWPLLKNTVEAIKKRIRKEAVGKWKTYPVSGGVDKILKGTNRKLWLWGAIGTT
jgi:hypothetical protein